VATRYVEDKVKTDNLKPGTWGVSIDIDETTLDNSWYFKNCTELADDENDFSAFVVKPELSKALPGVIDFTKKVHELGGYVSLVSNRDGSYKYDQGGVLDSTINNLKKEGVYFDQVVLANRKDSKTPSDKNPRFKSIESGNYDAAQMVWSNKLPAHKLIAWCGDNIQDFPVFKQKNLIGVQGSSDTFDHFSNGYFMFPNPMYGSWQANEYK
jgi:predicted secreted acid phosphatase